VDRATYQHNFQAARSFHIGPYHRPAHWAAHHWAYGQILPRGYWAPEYLLADYWLFGLEVPPGGYEWVRDDDDAILVNIGNGEIMQVEYGAFG
jgi:Ni/Co efflux regulator RcnB